MQPEDVARAAAILFSARQNLRPITDLPPALQPQTIVDAYAIQDAVVAMQGPIAGWKLGMPAASADQRCAPVAAPYVFASPADSMSGALLIAPEIEVEIAVRFARDLPPREAPYTAVDVEAAIGSVHPALEILSLRYVNRRAVAPLS